MKVITFLAMACVSSVGVAAISGTPPRAGSDGSRPDASPGDSALIERFLQSGQPELRSYAARRRLAASTWGGRMEAGLEAWTYLDPDGTFRFEIVQEEGSELIRKRVLRAALEAEQRSRQQRDMDQAALTRANYQFEVAEAAPDGLVAIRLVPRRKSRMLLDGTVLARPDSGDLVRVAGRLSDPPSWWTRQVDIVRRYARIQGVRVPVEMGSTADVRIAGASSFSMTYDYAMVNGHQVERASKAEGAQATR